MTADTLPCNFSEPACIPDGFTLSYALMLIYSNLERRSLMKRVLLHLAMLLVVVALVSCNAPQRKTSLEEGKEEVSYALGLNIGASIKQLDADVDLDILVQAIRDTLEDRGSLLNESEFRKVLTDFQRDVRLERNKKRQAKAGENLKEGKEFLEANKNKEGVVTTASGLQYKVLVQGDGPKPKADDKVKVHYRGTLIDGTEFDSSYKRGAPVTFPVKGVIKGWTEALQLMNVGSKYELYVPSDLAYGSRGTGGDIGPNATLIFEVELLEIVK